MYLPVKKVVYSTRFREWLRIALASRNGKASEVKTPERELSPNWDNNEIGRTLLKKQC